MTRNQKADIAKEIIKHLTNKSKDIMGGGQVNHSYTLGALEVVFEDVFSRLSNEDAEIVKSRFNL